MNFICALFCIEQPMVVLRVFALQEKPWVSLRVISLREIIPLERANISFLSFSLSFLVFCFYSQYLALAQDVSNR